MMDSPLTRHAAKRLQQRGISPFVIELLERFGSTMRCSGAERLFFDKPALRRLKAYLGGDRGLNAMEEWLRVYLVLSDTGDVVAVAHQDGRFHRLL